jgi:hypothetical protein
MALTEGRHTGEFIMTLGNGNISFDNATLASGENLAAGTVLAMVDDEFIGAALVWPDGISDNHKADAIAQLAAQHILVR